MGTPGGQSLQPGDSGRIGALLRQDSRDCERGLTANSSPKWTSRTQDAIDWMFVPPKPLCCNLIPKMMVFGGEGFRGWLDNEDETIMSGISAIIRETLESSLPFPDVRRRGEDSCLWTRKLVPTRHCISWCLDLSRPGPQNCEKSLSVVYKPNKQSTVSCYGLRHWASHWMGWQLDKPKDDLVGDKSSEANKQDSGILWRSSVHLSQKEKKKSTRQLLPSRDANAT